MPSVGEGGGPTAAEVGQSLGVWVRFPVDDGEIFRGGTTGGNLLGGLSAPGWLYGGARRNLMGRAPRRRGPPSPGREMSPNTQCVGGIGEGREGIGGGSERSGESGWSDGSDGSGENTETDDTRAQVGRRGR